MPVTKFKEGESFKEATYKQDNKRFDNLTVYRGEVIQYQIKKGKQVSLWSYICPSMRLNKEDAIADAIFEKQYC